MSSVPSCPPIPKVWLIGGTSESVTLAEQMQVHQIPVVVTVTTEVALQNYQLSPRLWGQVQRFLTDDALQDWLQESGVVGILDASHPFAAAISARAMRVAQVLNLSFLRFERTAVTAVQSEQIKEVNQDTKRLSREALQGQRVLLAVGSRSLSEFSRWHSCAELFARILPTESAIKLAYQAGFRRDHLIAFQPPLSFDLECALWKHWDISLAITKASGHPGGEHIKRQVAETLQVPLWVIKRPQLDYPWKTQSLMTAIHFGKQVTMQPSNLATGHERGD